MIDILKNFGVYLSITPVINISFFKLSTIKSFRHDWDSLVKFLQFERKIQTKIQYFKIGMGKS